MASKIDKKWGKDTKDLHEMYADITETIEVLHKLVNNMWELYRIVINLTIEEIEKHEKGNERPE